MAALFDEGALSQIKSASNNENKIDETIALERCTCGCGGFKKPEPKNSKILTNTAAPAVIVGSLGDVMVETDSLSVPMVIVEVDAISREQVGKSAVEIYKPSVLSAAGSGSINEVDIPPILHEEHKGSCSVIVDDHASKKHCHGCPSDNNCDVKIQNITVKPEYVSRWGGSILIPPEQCLTHLLQSRGYQADKLAVEEMMSRRPALSPKQIRDYDNQIVMAVRTSDIDTLKGLHVKGRSMMASNKFGESILHLACRRATPELVKYMLENGGDLRQMDDYGRNPLHDACWRSEPQFEIVRMILDRDLELLRMQDVRGATPLNYVRQEHWMHWCAFLYHHREKYWAVRRK